jgi:hypothetical protein
MAAAEYNITVSQNADFTRAFQLKQSNVVVDLTGSSFEAKIKKNYNETASTSFTASVTNATAGLWEITLTDTQTAALAPGDQVYDVIMTDSAGVKTRLLQGKAYISPGVS